MLQFNITCYDVFLVRFMDSLLVSGMYVGGKCVCEAESELRILEVALTVELTAVRLTAQVCANTTQTVPTLSSVGWLQEVLVFTSSKVIS